MLAACTRAAPDGTPASLQEIRGSDQNSLFCTPEGLQLIADRGVIGPRDCRDPLDGAPPLFCPGSPAVSQASRAERHAILAVLERAFVAGLGTSSPGHSFPTP